MGTGLCTPINKTSHPLPNKFNYCIIYSSPNASLGCTATNCDYCEAQKIPLLLAFLQAAALLFFRAPRLNEVMPRSQFIEKKKFKTNKTQFEENIYIYSNACRVPGENNYFAKSNRKHARVKPVFPVAAQNKMFGQNWSRALCGLGRVGIFLQCSGWTQTGTKPFARSKRGPPFSRTKEQFSYGEEVREWVSTQYNATKRAIIWSLQFGFGSNMMYVYLR